jgi:hypothetical protein
MWENVSPSPQIKNSVSSHDSRYESGNSGDSNNDDIGCTFSSLDSEILRVIISKGSAATVRETVQLLTSTFGHCCGNISLLPRMDVSGSKGRTGEVFFKLLSLISLT